MQRSRTAAPIENTSRVSWDVVMLYSPCFGSGYFVIHVPNAAARRILRLNGRFLTMRPDWRSPQGCQRVRLGWYSVQSSLNPRRGHAPETELAPPRFLERCGWGPTSADSFQRARRSVYGSGSEAERVKRLLSDARCEERICGGWCGIHHSIGEESHVDDFGPGVAGGRLPGE